MKRTYLFWILFIVVLVVWSIKISADSFNEEISNNNVDAGVKLKLELIAKEAVIAQNQTLISGPMALINSPLASSYQKAIEKSLADKLNEYNLLAKNQLAYTNFQTDLKINDVTVNGDKAILLATEHTSLTITLPAGPSIEEYELKHTFHFVKKDNGSEWILIKDQLPNGPKPEGLKPGEAPVDGPSTVKFSGVILPEEQLIAPQAAGTLNRNAIVSYAYQYWSSPNPAYKSYVDIGNDCTNFASQALTAGGWCEVVGFFTFSSAWWYGSADAWPYHSNSWSVANSFYEFTKNRPRALIAPYFSSMSVGDILQVDWNDANSNSVPDGYVDHTMIVTRKDSNGEIFLTYHSGANGIPVFEKSISTLLSLKPNARWYGWHLYTYLD